MTNKKKKNLVNHPNNFKANQNYRGWFFSLTKYYGFHQ